MYFITFCTYQRMPYLGEVIPTGDAKNGATVRLTAYGKICNDVIERISDDFADVETIEFVIMPNHVHAVLAILPENDLVCSDGNRNVELIPKIVASIKRRTTYRVRKLDPGIILWQRSYHDRVIRDKGELDSVLEYIRNNPLKWALDRFYIE